MFRQDEKTRAARAEQKKQAVYRWRAKNREKYNRQHREYMAAQRLDPIKRDALNEYQRTYRAQKVVVT